MSKDSGKVDTGLVGNQMAATNAVAQQQLALSQQALNYGIGRTAKYADPVLNEFQRIMGFGPQAQQTAGTQVPGGWLTGLPSGGGQVQVGTAGGQPLYESGGNFFTQGAGTPATGGGTPSMYQDTKSGQLYGADTPGITPIENWVSNADPRYQLASGNDLLNLKAVNGSVPAANAGIGAMVPWSGDTSSVKWGSGINFSTTKPTSNRYVSPTESGMMQLPVATAQAQAKQAKASILRSTKPGPQQTVLLAQVDNQTNQSLGQSAFSNVNNMLNSLLSTSGAAQTGFSQAGTLMSNAATTTAQAGTMATQLTQLQQQAAQSNNSMLSGIFSTIGTIGGFALGGPLGGALGGALGGTTGNLVSGVSDSIA